LNKKLVKIRRFQFCNRTILGHTTNKKQPNTYYEPTTNIRVRIRIREITKIFEKVTNKIEEHEQSTNTKIFVRAKSIEWPPDILDKMLFEFEKIVWNSENLVVPYRMKPN